MTEKEYIEKLYLDYQHIGLTRGTVKNMVKTVFNTICEELIRHQKFGFQGFGTLSVIQKKAKRLIHPGNQKSILCPEHFTIKFIPSSSVKKKLNPRKKS